LSKLLLFALRLDVSGSSTISRPQHPIYSHAQTLIQTHTYTLSLSPLTFVGLYFFLSDKMIVFVVLLRALTLLNSGENEHCRWVSTFDSRPLDILSAGTCSFSLGPLVQVPMYLWHDVNSTNLCHYRSLMVLNDCFVLSGNSLV
jgi:hypothetical protein